MGLLEAIFKMRPREAPYTNKAPMSAFEQILADNMAKNPNDMSLASLIPQMMEGGNMRMMPINQSGPDPNTLAAVNAALSAVSPAAGKLKQAERPDGLLNLYNLLKDRTIYRNTW